MEQLLEKLKEFGALRDDDECETKVVERQEPIFIVRHFTARDGWLYNRSMQVYNETEDMILGEGGSKVDSK